MITMKKQNFLGVLLLLLISTAVRAQVLYTYLDVNEKVEKYPSVTWIKGSGISQFEKGKIYVVELWATWCKPCIKSMPHFSALSTQFKDKITFIAQGVWEGDTAKVKKFVTDNASYFTNSYVAFDGEKDRASFDKNWLKPSGTYGIPRTFLIRNNTIIWITDPFTLTAEHLQALVDGTLTEATAKAIAKKNQP